MDVLRLRLAVEPGCQTMCQVQYICIILLWFRYVIHVLFFQVALSMLREEGIASFYSGLGPSLVGIAPYIAINFCIFDLWGLLISFSLVAFGDLKSYFGWYAMICVGMIGWRSHYQKNTKRGHKHLLQLLWFQQHLPHLCVTLSTLWEDRCKWKVHLIILFLMLSQVTSLFPIIMHTIDDIDVIRIEKQSWKLTQANVIL